MTRSKPQDTMADLPDDIFQYIRVKQDLARVKQQLQTLRKRIARETIHTQAAVWYDLIATAYAEMLNIDKSNEAAELRDHYIQESRERGVPALRELPSRSKNHGHPANDGKTPKRNSDSKPRGVGAVRGETRLPAAS